MITALLALVLAADPVSPPPVTTLTQLDGSWTNRSGYVVTIGGGLFVVQGQDGGFTSALVATPARGVLRLVDDGGALELTYHLDGGRLYLSGPGWRCVLRRPSS